MSKQHNSMWGAKAPTAALHVILSAMQQHMLSQCTHQLDLRVSTNEQPNCVGGVAL
jgi:hypothetical protein